MIDWTGLRDFRANFRLWRNIVSRKKPHEWQLTTFWYWLNYYSGGN